MSNVSKYMIILFAILIVILLIFDGFIINEMSAENLSEKPFPKFHTKDLKGQVFDNNIFDGKISIVCVWSTNADICFEFLKNLNDLQIPANVQIIGLVGDVKDNDNADKLNTAQKISENYSAGMINLLVNDDFLPLLQFVKTIPFTCFVDEQGNFIGQPIIGNEINLVKLELDRILQKNSPRMQTLEEIQKIILKKL